MSTNIDNSPNGDLNFHSFAPKAGALTYKDLIRIHAEQNTEENSPEQLLAFEANLEGFLRSCGRIRQDLIGAELGDDFERRLAAYTDTRPADGETPGDADVNSQLRTYKLAWDTFRISAAPPVFNVLHDAVDYYFTKANVAQMIIANELGVSDGWISALRNKHENALATSRAFLQSLEARLGAPSGIFTQFVITPSEGEPLRSKYVERLVRLRALPPYRLRPDPVATPMLHLELIDHLAFKTNAAEKMFDNSINRGRPWRLRNVIDFHRIITWTRPYCTVCNGTLVAPTAILFVEHVVAFFGSLREIDPKQYVPAMYSLAWMCDTDLMEKVVSYLSKRFGGYNSTIDCVVRTGKQLTNSKHGFVTQNLYFSQRLPIPVASANWKGWIKEQDERLLFGLNCVRDGGATKLRTRDPEDPIKKYLDWQHPTKVIEELLINMIEKMPGISGLRNRLAMRRDILLVRMLAEQPLRALMYGNLTCTANNQGSLYRQYQSDGNYRWAIKFPAEDFKNWLTAQFKRYDVCFSAETSDEIDIYFDEVRPKYPAGDRVFTTWARRDNSTTGDQCKADELERTILIRTRTLLDGCVGFGMNAFRNLAATEIIRNDEDGYEIAAETLHDEIETVRIHYAHITAKYGQSKYVERIRNIREAGRARLEPSSPTTIANPSDAVSALAKDRGISYEQALAEMKAFLVSQRW